MKKKNKNSDLIKLLVENNFLLACKLKLLELEIKKLKDKFNV